jgi:hypothetical protein
MTRTSAIVASASALCLAAAGWAADEPPSLVDALRLETHGFVSFGHLRTWGNNVYADDTIDGSDEFHEAALNAIARPLERVRLGAQLFMRDLGRYDNGRVELDWAYVDVQLDPLCDVQLGRVKIPLGLFNEIQDVDAARTPVFLPQSLYASRLRDLQISVDGGKVSGRLDLERAGAFSYTVFGGTKHLDDHGSYAVYVGEASRIRTTDAEVGTMVGGMLHWDTPLPEVGVRLSALQSRDIIVDGTSPFGPAHFDTDSRSLVASLLWEPGDWTLAAEYLHLTTTGDATIGATTQAYDFAFDSGYLSVTWHAAPWLELYGAAEYRHNDLAGRPTNFGWSWIGALNLMPLRHWAVKAEYQFQDNNVTVLAADNPQGVAPRWHLLALKTTVDF